MTDQNGKDSESRRLPLPMFDSKDQKCFIFEGEKIWFNFKLFKYYSKMFSNNKEYKYVNEFKFEYPKYIDEKSFKTFIDSCQHIQFEITENNIYSLLYLSQRFDVYLLKIEINKYLENSQPELVFKIFKDYFTLFNKTNDHDEFFDISKLEELIGKSLIKYLEIEEYRNFLCSIPIPILHNILIFYNKFNLDESNILIDFLFETLYERKSECSILFSLIDFGKNTLQVLHRLRKFEKDTNSKFNYSYLNETLLNSITELIDENKQIRTEAEEHFENVKREINDKLENNQYLYLITIIQDLIIGKFQQNDKSNQNTKTLTNQEEEIFEEMLKNL